MNFNIFAILLSAISTLFVFGVNVFVIYGLSRLFKIGGFKFSEKKVLLKKSLKLSLIVAIVSFVLSVFATIFILPDFNIVLNSFFFLVNAAVFIIVGVKIFDERMPKILLLWAFVFSIDFIAGILISAVLNLLI